MRNVGCAVSRQTDTGLVLLSLGINSYRISYLDGSIQSSPDCRTVRDRQVDREDRKDDGPGWGEEPGGFAERADSRRLVEHDPPTGRGFREAEADKRQRRLRQDERREQERPLDGQEAARGREQVA